MILKEEISQIAEQYPKLLKIWLFGSRARKENLPTSDFDLAFEWEKNTERDLWIRFKTLLLEEVHTLHAMDLIYLNEAPPQLKTNILKKGKLIYEKNQRKNTKFVSKS